MAEQRESAGSSQLDDEPVGVDFAAEVYHPILVELPRLAALETGSEFAAIARDTIIAAGLDPLAVFAWVERAGGYEGSAYLRAAHKPALGTCRPPLHPTSYFAIPVAALEPRGL